MHEEFVSLGTSLRQRRLEQHLSLKEVENATSIRMSYLSAIEEGEVSKLISPIYAQGFIKQYATFLEIDGESLIQQYPAVLKLLNDSKRQASEFTLGLGSIEIRGTPGSEVKWLPNLLWVGISTVVILGGWFLARYLGFF